MTEQLWTIGKVLAWTKDRFSERAIASPRLDAEVLLAHVLKRDRVALYTHLDQPLAPDELAGYRELIKRRLGGEPVAYLVGRREFRSLELLVDARVLVPRPDTETLVDAALSLLPAFGGARAPRVVDVGTGSGAVAVAIAVERPDVMVIAVERSPEAAEVARENVARHAPGIVVHVGDLLAPIGEEAIDLVVSNPPYIPSGDLAGLQIEVQREPKMALDGGADGLEVVRRLATEAWQAPLRRRRDRDRDRRRAGGGGRADLVARRLRRATSPSRPRRHRARGERKKARHNLTTSDPSAVVVRAR